jgi:hypothetical protein
MVRACKTCGSPINEDMKVCVKCGSKPSPISKALKSIGRVLLWACVGAFLLLVTTTSFDPFQTYHMRRANMLAVSARGKDIYVSITCANIEREESLKLPSLLPKTYLATTNYPGDISSKIYKTSSDYFYELYDGPNVGTAKHNPYVKGFDYSKLAGAGVPAKAGGGKLTATNNVWAIAANITEGDDDLIPLLVTRNMDVKAIERVVNFGIKANEFNKAIAVGKGDYKTPFGDKGFFCLRKCGGTFTVQKNQTTFGELFGNRELPPRDPSKPPIVYLMP